MHMTAPVAGVVRGIWDAALVEPQGHGVVVGSRSSPWIRIVGDQSLSLDPGQKTLGEPSLPTRPMTAM